MINSIPAVSICSRMLGNPVTFTPDVLNLNIADEAITEITLKSLCHTFMKYLQRNLNRFIDYGIANVFRGKCI